VAVPDVVLETNSASDVDDAMGYSGLSLCHVQGLHALTGQHPRTEKDMLYFTSMAVK
jgi:hypothetical protein